MTLAAVSSLTWLLSVCPAGALDDQTSESLRNNETGQEIIQTQVQELASQLQAMSAEFTRNGLKGDEVKTLDLLSASISTMSAQDMARIIALLRQARTAGDPRGLLQQVAAAYTWQKSLTVQMNGLLSTYQKDQAAANVAATLSKLAERQTANLQTGITVAQWNQGKKADDAQSELKAALEVQSSEQAALRDEAKQAATRLEAAAKDATDPAAATRAQAALQKLNQLNAALDQATNDLKDGHIFKALANEKQARDGMRQLARELTPLREAPADALRQAEKDMANMIAQQKAMLADTEKVKNAPTDVAKWVQQELTNPKSEVAKAVKDEKNGLAGQNPDQLAENNKMKGIFQRSVTTPNEQKLSSLESKSNELVDRGDQMSQDLQKDAAQAAAAVKAAQAKMQAARADLDDHNAASAALNQQAALVQMEQAQTQVQTQIAAHDAAQNADRMTQLQAAKAQAQALAAQQSAAAQQHAAQPQAGASNAAQEAGLKNMAQALQEKAVQAQALAAVAAIQQAAAQMQNAANALEQPAGQAQAAAAEAAAAASLQTANAQLDKDIAQTAAAQQQLQKVDQALAALEKIITGQERVQADTALASASPTAPAKPEKRAAKIPVAAKTPGTTEIAAQQADLKTNTAALAQTLTTPEVQPAVDPLNSAQSQMESSHGALARSNPMAARDPQRFVITDLLQAKQVLSSKKAELAQQTNPAAAQSAQEQQNAQLADQIAQALAQAQAAQAQLAQAQPQQGQQQQGQQQSGQPQSRPQTAQMQNAQQALEQAANSAGQAAANNAASSQSHALQPALADAQQALNQAASAAAAGNQATAQAQTDRAQQALTQAQGQAQAAQSGLAQADQNGAMPPGSASADDQQGAPPTGQQVGPTGSRPVGKPGAKGQKGPGQPSGPQQAANGADQPGESSQDAQASTSDDPRDPSKIGQSSIEKGTRGTTRQGSAFATLPARDRAALQQSQAEKYPQEYGAMIEQYMQSLADQPGS